MGPTTVSVVTGSAPACRTTEPHAAASAKLASVVRRETTCRVLFDIRADMACTFSSLCLGAVEDTLEDRVDLREMKIEVEVGDELAVAQMLADLDIGFQQRQEIAFPAPGLHGVALH